VRARARLDPAALDGARAQPASRLVTSQRARVQRIVDAVVRLAEQGGFEGVRLREVADVSGVALGTLYKYFHSKEDVLLFALTAEIEKLEASMASDPPTSTNPLERLTEFFQRATRGLVRKPHLARAVLRSLAAGHHQTAARVARFHSRMTRMIVAALEGAPQPSSNGRGKRRAAVPARELSDLAFILQNVWFSSLVGWAGGLHNSRTVSEHVRTAAALMRIGDKEG
jgi:TetR/AcrR family transcriptional regulator, cholesterol catabolism regulator